MTHHKHHEDDDEHHKRRHHEDAEKAKREKEEARRLFKETFDMVLGQGGDPKIQQERLRNEERKTIAEYRARIRKWAEDRRDSSARLKAQKEMLKMHGGKVLIPPAPKPGEKPMTLWDWLTTFRLHELEEPVQVVPSHGLFWLWFAITVLVIAVVLQGLMLVQIRHEIKAIDEKVTDTRSDQRDLMRQYNDQVQRHNEAVQKQKWMDGQLQQNRH